MSNGTGNPESGVPAITEKKTRETSPSREQVIGSFNRAFGSFEADYNNNLLDARERWAFESVRSAKEKTLEQNRPTFSNEVVALDGSTFTLQEGIPANDLVAHLTKKLSELTDKKARGEPIDEQKLEQYLDDLKIIDKARKFYYRRKHRGLTNDMLDARVRQEAHLISCDVRNTGSNEENWKLAHTELSARGELVIPEEKKVRKVKTRTNQPPTVAQNVTPPVITRSQAEDPEDRNPVPPVVNGQPQVLAQNVVNLDVAHPRLEDPEDRDPVPPPAAVADLEPGPREELGEPTHTLRAISREYLFNIGAQNEAVRKLTAEEAEEKLNREIAEGMPEMPTGKGWRVALTRIGRQLRTTLSVKFWKEKFPLLQTKEYHRQKYISEHYRELRETNFSAGGGLARAGADRAMEQVRELRKQGRATAERMNQEQGVFRGEIGPREVTPEFRRFVVNEILKPVIGAHPRSIPPERVDEIESQIQGKLYEYTRLHQDDDTIKEFFGENRAERYGQMSEFYASNLIDVAQKIIDDGRGLDFVNDRMDDLVKIRLFKARLAEQTESKKSWADRLMEFGSSHRRLGLLNNAATAGIIADTAAFFLSKPTLGLRAAMTITPVTGALAGGVYAGLRRGHDLTDYYKTVGRQMERNQNLEAAGTGGQWSEVAKRMAPMAKVSELLGGGGNELLGGATRRNLRELLADPRANRADLVRRYGEIKARLDYPVLPQETRRFIFFRGPQVPREMGMVRYGEEGMEVGRLELARAMGEMRAALLDPARGGMTPDMLDNVVNRWNEQLIQGKEQQDQAFNRYRLGQQLESGAGAAGLGLVLGLAGQEFVAVGFRALGHDVATTTLEQGVNFAAGRELIHGNTGISAFQEVFKTPNGKMEAVLSGNDKISVVSPAHPGAGQLPEVSITDSHNADLLGGTKLHLTANGQIITDGPLSPKLEAELHTSRFEIVSGPDNPLVVPGANHVEINGPNPTISIPNGTHWVKDGNGWDLVVSDGNGKISHLIDHATVSPEGRLIVNPHDVKGVTIDEVDQHIPGVTNTETVKVLGPDGEWAKHATTVNEFKAYDYGTRPLPAEFNELGVHTIKEGDGIRMTMYDMKYASQLGRIPDPNTDINVLPDVVKQGRAMFGFINATDRDHQWLVFGDSKGTLLLNPLDTDPNHFVTFVDGTRMQLGAFSKIVLDHDAYKGLANTDVAFEKNGILNAFKLGGPKPDINNPGWVFAGEAVKHVNGQDQVVTEAAGNYITPTDHVIVRDFGAIRGIGQTTDLTNQVTTPGKNLFATDIHLLNQPSRVIIPPDEVPIIPLPEIARWPLERAVAPDRERPYGYAYGYYYDQIPEATREYYLSRVSERLRGDPNRNLRPEEEIPEYLARLDPAYRRRLETLLAQEGIRAPMEENCDAVVCIPVYTLGEGQVINNALENYLLQFDKTRNKQAIDPRKAEILIYLNHPKDKREDLEKKLGRSFADGSAQRVRDGKPEPYDSEEVIKQFAAQHPELRIRVIKEEFEKQKQWGKIIKPLYDIALLRASQRQNPYRKDPLIITNDVDVVTLSPTYLRDILQTMDLNEISASRNSGVRKLDALAGKTDMPNRGYEKIPGFLASERLYQYLDTQMRHETQTRKNKVIMTQGRNTVLRASTYAAIGGANENSDAGADVELGKMISIARRSPETINYLNSAWLETDPRRELGMWLKGIPLAYAWSEWSAMNVYGKNWKDQFKAPPQDPSKLDSVSLQREIKTEMQRWGLGTDSKEIKRALNYLGLRPVDYHVENGEIVIDHLDNVIENLKDYVAEARWETLQRKRSEELKAPQIASVDGKFYAEYLNYEEYDRLYSDIFESKEYPWTPPNKPKPKIIDLGSHIGMSVLFWKSLAPGAEITAVEANPDTAKILERNIKRNHLTGVKAIHAAASADKGFVNLYMPKEGIDFHWGDFVSGTPMDPDKYDRYPAPAVQLSSLITGPVDLLKIDIEGSESEVLREAESKLPQVKEVMLEFHHDPGNPANSLADTLTLLRRQGYQMDIRQWNQPVDLRAIDMNQPFFLTILAKRP